MLTCWFFSTILVSAKSTHMHYLLLSTGGTNQQWHYDATSMHLYTAHSNEKCLDYDFRLNNIYMNDCHSDDNQKFQVPFFWKEDITAKQFPGWGSNNPLNQYCKTSLKGPRSPKWSPDTGRNVELDCNYPSLVFMDTDVYEQRITSKGVQCGAAHGAAKALWDGKENQNTGAGGCNALVSGQAFGSGATGDTSPSVFNSDVLVDFKSCWERKNLYEGSDYKAECLVSGKDGRGKDIYKEMCQSFYGQLPYGEKHGETTCT